MQSSPRDCDQPHKPPLEPPSYSLLTSQASVSSASPPLLGSANDTNTFTDSFPYPDLMSHSAVRGDVHIYIDDVSYRFAADFL